jgi:putative SOS response-associated peptidase YedK
LWSKRDRSELFFRRRGPRCLVVTNGFYEWKKLNPKGRLKQAYAVGMADDGAMVMGGFGRHGAILPTARKSRAARYMRPERCDGGQCTTACR